MFGTMLDDLERRLDTVAATARAVASTDVDPVDASCTVLRLERLRARFDHVVLGVLGDCDARGLAQAEGAYSMANWLSSRTGERRSVSGSRLFLARKLQDMPNTDVALGDGAITDSHARVLTRALNPRTVDAFARDESLLVDAGRKLTADQLVQVVEFWLRHNDLDGPEPDSRVDVFHLSTTLAGRLKGDFDIGGDLAVLVKATIDEIVSQVLARDRALAEVDPTDPLAGETAAQRRARALGELCERAGVSPKNPARRQPLFNLHTTIDTLAGTGDPTDWLAEVEHEWRSALPHDLLSLWACDCHVARVVLNADGVVLDLGRSARLATPDQKRALAARDQGCAVPGCDRPVGWCDAHHVVWWARGGPTDVGNLVLTCRHHHRRIHAGHLHVRIQDDRPRFALPDGTQLEEPRAGPQAPAA